MHASFLDRLSPLEWGAPGDGDLPCMAGAVASRAQYRSMHVAVCGWTRQERGTLLASPGPGGGRETGLRRGRLHPACCWGRAAGSLPHCLLGEVDRFLSSRFPTAMLTSIS
jgi:hypothetical protein